MVRTVFVEEAAARLGVSRRTVYYRIQDGRLQTVRCGGSQRVLVESIEALLRAERQAGGRLSGVPERFARSSAP